MSVLVPSTETEQDIFSTSNLFLQQRLKLIEDLWKEVLVSECGQELVDLLELLRHLCSEEGQVTDDSPEATIAKMIEDLEHYFTGYFPISNRLTSLPKKFSVFSIS